MTFSDATQSQSPPAPGAALAFIETHPSLALGVGVVGIIVIGGFFLRKSTVGTGPGVPAPNAPDLTGLQNGKVYVPTSTTFTTNNVGADYSNDPQLTTITSGAISVNSPTSSTQNTNTGNTSTNTGTGGAPTPVPWPVDPPRHSPPAPGPTPPKGEKHRIWDQRHTIGRGETLTTIAAGVQQHMRSGGMPGSVGVTWSDLYGHNQSIIESAARAHGFNSSYWLHVFEGETITVPRWG